MKPPAILALGIWLLVVGGNMIRVQTIAPELFMRAPGLPWLVVLLPLVIVVGAFSRRRPIGETRLEGWVDRRLGLGTYREFMDALRPELLFAAMCFGIVLSAVARTFLFNTTVLPPQVLGFFGSGGVAFMAAYWIRRRREGA